MSSSKDLESQRKADGNVRRVLKGVTNGMQKGLRFTLAR
jgi:hypothetical protein